IRRIRELKDATPPDEFRRSAEQGVRDCWTRGVTCVADTGSTGAVVEALARLGGRGIAYHEVFGPDPAQAEPSLARFPDEVAPLAALRAAGVRVGLGTDSVVSVGDLDLWAEAEAAGWQGAEALRMLTIEGARALCWERVIGSLEVGKAADLAVFPPTALYRP